MRKHQRHAPHPRDLPPSLGRLLVDCEAGEKMRLVRGCLSRTGGNLEMAFLLSGFAPTPDRPARVVDAQPVDSFSSSARVDTAPAALMSARAVLLARNREETPGIDIIAIAHTHPSGCTRFSTVDQEWHSDCLDTNFREELVVEIPARERDAGSSKFGPAKLQLFWSIILPASGRLDEASAYLLSRPHGGDRQDDSEVEIGLTYTECERAERDLEDLRLRVDWRTRWEARLSYEWNARHRFATSGADTIETDSWTETAR